MGNFEDIIRILFTVAGALFLPIASVAAIAAIRVIWRRGSTAAMDGDIKQQLADIQARLDELERRGLTSGEVNAQYDRLAELEERVEFAERLLAGREQSPQLPERGAAS